jgi:DNA-binding response OmpR family regulator
MAIVFVIATDWQLRATVRAELRELNIDALGMDSPDDAGRALAANQMPDVIVLEATADVASNPAIQNLIKRVPTVVIAARTEWLPSFATDDLSALAPGSVMLYRPVTVGDIVKEVHAILARTQTP